MTDNTTATGSTKDNEAALLASLGSSTADASIYESSILRDAKLRSAPQMELPHADIARAIAANNSSAAFNASAVTNGGGGPSLIPCGKFGIQLPDLSGLAPSTCCSSSDRQRNNNGGGSAEDVPHLLTVLSKVRKSLHSAQQSNYHVNNDEEMTRKRHIDLLHMKEQLCLTYLHNVAGISEDDGIIPADHYKKRRRRISSSSGGGKVDASDDYYGVRQEIMNREQDEDCSSRNDTMKPAAAKKGGKVASSSQNHVSRLDQIKNGHQFNHSNNNNNDNNDATNTTKPQPRKRNTIMSLKSQMRIDNGLTPLKSMEEERYDAEQSRKRREERKRRRLKRRREMLGWSGDNVEESDDDEEAEFVEESVNKVADDGTKVVAKNVGILRGKSEEGDDVVSETKRGVRWAGEELNDFKDSNNATTDTDKRSTTKVYCPICETILIFNNDKGDEDEGGDTPDAFLSRHIAECQQSSGGRGRTTRTSKRKKRRVVDYSEKDVDSEKMETGGGPASTKKKSVDWDSQFDPNEPSTNNQNGTKRKESLLHNPTSIDDMDEFDYEDRTEYWAKFGLKQMSKMAEQDSTEIPPGAEVYDGGLEIPAWVNNRLFPYQRIGLRWMWELHCQGVGGCVGDEMGLGKTVQVSSFLGAMAANRFIDSVLIVAPATMLAHWLSELSVWAPGLRRIMMHRSGETDGASRVVSKGMLRSLQKWLKNARSDRLNEAIDDDDYNDKGADSFCGSGYAIVTTYESIRRSPDEYVNHNWSYVVLDEGQKIRNPDADVTLACKRLRTPHRLLLSG